MRKLKLALAAIGYLVGPKGWAQIPLPASVSACQADVVRWCDGVTPGEGRVVACLKSHEDQLSPECTAVAKKIRKQARSAFRACFSDYRRLCDDVSPGGGRIVRCLYEKREEVSPSCRQGIAAVGELLTADSK